MAIVGSIAFIAVVQHHFTGVDAGSVAWLPTHRVEMEIEHSVSCSEPHLFLKNVNNNNK